MNCLMRCGYSVAGVFWMLSGGFVQAQPPQVNPSEPNPFAVALEENPRPVMSLEQVLAKLGGPTLVTLNFEATPLEEVLLELSRQSGDYRFKSSKDAKKLVTLDIEKRPLWETVRELQKSYDISAERGDGNMNMSLAKAKTPVWFTSGLMAIPETISWQTNRVMNFNNEEMSSNDSFRFSFHVLSDPKLQPRFLYTVEVESAQDDTGKNLNSTRIIPAGVQDLDARFSRAIFQLNLLPPSPKASRIARLQGNLYFLQEQSQQVWEIDDLENLKRQQKQAKEFTLNGIKNTYTLETLDTNGEVTQLRLRGAVPSANRKPRSGVHLPRVVQPRITLLDQNGRAFSKLGHGGSSDNEQFLYTLNYNPPRNAQKVNTPQPGLAQQVTGEASVPTKLRLELPDDVALVKVPFEFQNIPLPKIVD